ncbi:hypothetical protein LCGC14_1069090 [marine sediment metagenome]|uniref:Uncharacterized protein n=1 Tax=marine sediment metagenome TaxID=412755 RepID=A0A0F9Q1V4_9ZZZZ
MDSNPAELSPCTITKVGLTHMLEGFLRSDEFIISWIITADDLLEIIIHKKGD